MIFESEEEYIAFRTWEYKMAQKKLCEQKGGVTRKKRGPVIPISEVQKRKIAYLRDLFLDKDADSKLSRAEVCSILGEARRKRRFEKKDVVSFLVRRAQSIVCSR